MEPSSSAPVKLAFTIGSYRLCDFVHLSLKQLKKLSPDSHVLVSDDAAPESGHIKAIAEAHGAQYRCSRVRKGHFASDWQSFINGLVFAESVGADIAIKVSQRFIFRKQEAIDAIVAAFKEPNIAIVTPGQPKMAFGFGSPSNGFGKFTLLTDIVAMRVGSVLPDNLLHLYRTRLMTEKVPWGSFIECTVDDLCRNTFPGRTLKLDSITNHTNVDDPSFLRRFQNQESQYIALAETHGIGGRFPTGEWAQIEGRSYLCKPLVV